MSRDGLHRSRCRWATTWTQPKRQAYQAYFNTVTSFNKEKGRVRTSYYIVHPSVCPSPWWDTNSSFSVWRAVLRVGGGRHLTEVSSWWNHMHGTGSETGTLSCSRTCSLRRSLHSLWTSLIPLAHFIYLHLGLYLDYKKHECKKHTNNLTISHSA